MTTSGFLQSADHSTANVGTFNDVGGNQTNIFNNQYCHSEEHIDDSGEFQKLLGNTVLGALWDANVRQDPPKCHPGTRGAIIDRIMRWAQDPEGLHLMWMYGPVGVGKSAIMHEVARLCLEKDINLGGSFFPFSPDDNSNIFDHLVPTLAYQLAVADHELRQFITETIRHDPAIFFRTLTTQMKSLILTPLAKLRERNPTLPLKQYLILIDGLDAFPRGSYEEIITLISNSAFTSLRFLIASRPEFDICDNFNLPTVSKRTEKLALDGTCGPDDDIRLFLRDQFKEIKTDHTRQGRSIPDSWPSEDDIHRLVWNASGHFIYVTTVIKYIASLRDNPITRLATVLETRLSPDQPDTPLAQLEALYHHIDESSSEIRVDIRYTLPHTERGSDTFLHKHMSPIDSIFNHSETDSPPYTVAPIKHPNLFKKSVASFFPPMRRRKDSQVAVAGKDQMIITNADKKKGLRKYVSFTKKK